MITGTEKIGFKAKIRAIRSDEIIPLYYPTNAMLLDAMKYIETEMRKKRYKINWKNKLNRESAKRCKERLKGEDK